MGGGGIHDVDLNDLDILRRKFSLQVLYPPDVGALQDTIE